MEYIYCAVFKKLRVQDFNLNGMLVLYRINSLTVADVYFSEAKGNEEPYQRT